jgi:glutamyl-tRNA synthetase
VHASSVVVAQRERTKTLKEMAHNSHFDLIDRLSVDLRAPAKHPSREALQTLAEVRERLSVLPQWNAAGSMPCSPRLWRACGAGSAKSRSRRESLGPARQCGRRFDAMLEFLGRDHTLARIDVVLATPGPGHA